MIASIAVLMGVPWIMVKEQPALSTSLVLIFIFCVILYAGGISYKLIFGALAVAIPAVIILVSLAMQPDSTILETYQKKSYPCLRQSGGIFHGSGLPAVELCNGHRLWRTGRQGL